MMSMFLMIIAFIVIIGLSVEVTHSLIRKYKRTSAGKISFKETLDLTDLPIITFKHNGKRINFLLDTGSSTSVINESVLPHVIHKSIEDKTSYYGIEGNRVDADLVYIEVEYKDSKFSDTFQVANLDKSFGILKSEHGVNLHGILGNSFFQKYKYIIDFDEFVAYSVK